MAQPQLPTHIDATPAQLAAARVPFAPARWYHMIGRHLRELSQWDVDRLIRVRLHLLAHRGAP